MLYLPPVRVRYPVVMPNQIAGLRATRPGALPLEVLHPPDDFRDLHGEEAQ